MRHTFLAIAAAALLVAAAGCARHSQHGMNGSCKLAPETCQSCDGPAMCKACGGRGCDLCMRHRAMDNAGRFTPGPPVGQISYPYYTTRGPRDFLERNPQPIGP